MGTVTDDGVRDPQSHTCWASVQPCAVGSRACHLPWSTLSMTF